MKKFPNLRIRLKGDAVWLAALAAVLVAYLIFDPAMFREILFVLYAAAFLPALAVGAVLGLAYLIWRKFASRRK